MLSPEQVEALRALPYERYLQTTWWYARRNQALRAAGYRCQRCATKRELQVHHLTYEHLGAELAEDLEVLCRGCHLGEHVNQVQTHVGLYTRILSDVIAEGDRDDLADILEEAKQRCAQLKVPLRHEEFHVAASKVLPRIGFTPRPSKAELYSVGAPHEPLSRAEAAGILARLGAARLMRHVPDVRPLTMRQMECRRALQIVAQAIVHQVAECEAAERRADLTAQDAATEGTQVERPKL